MIRHVWLCRAKGIWLQKVQCVLPNEVMLMVSHDSNMREERWSAKFRDRSVKEQGFHQLSFSFPFHLVLYPYALKLSVVHTQKHRMHTYVRVCGSSQEFIKSKYRRKENCCQLSAIDVCLDGKYSFNPTVLILYILLFRFIYLCEYRAAGQIRHFASSQFLTVLTYIKLVFFDRNDVHYPVGKASNNGFLSSKQEWKCHCCQSGY